MAPESNGDAFPILGIDHIEFWVGNAKQAAFYYANAFGFSPAAYSGLETGVRDRTSHLVTQGDIRFVFTGALGPDSPIAAHVARHGDGVRDVAFRVPDAEDAYRVALARGATGVSEPTVTEDEGGKVVRAAIAHIRRDDPLAHPARGLHGRVPPRLQSRGGLTERARPRRRADRRRPRGRQRRARQDEHVGLLLRRHHGLLELGPLQGR